MNTFLLTMASFPTAIWSTLLVVLVLYWILVSIGMLDIDIGGADLDLDLDADAQVTGIAGLLATLGLQGVPLPVVMTLLVANGWILSYFGSLFFVPDVALAGLLLGLVVLVASAVIAVPFTSWQIKPLRKLFQKSLRKPLHIAVQGQVCRVRSSRCDEQSGEAEVNYEGASLLVKIRTSEGPFKKGDSVVIVKHDAEQNVFFVIGQDSFAQQ